jgi:hypothetical protein
MAISRRQPARRHVLPQNDETRSAGVQRTMQKLLTCTILCFLSTVLASCRGKPEESVTEVKNGAFKILVRSQEFHHSGIRNIDICVAEISSRGFPAKRIQCLHGFDFSGLSVKWQSQREIEISFDCGRVSTFANYAVVSPDGSLPEDFHATLRDGCSTESKDPQTGDAKRRSAEP